MDPNQILQLLMQLLTEPPDQPAGDVPSGIPPTGSPMSARHLSEEDEMMAQLNMLAQGLLQQQSAQQMQNGAQGGQGGMFGGMGGRPPGS